MRLTFQNFFPAVIPNPRQTGREREEGRDGALKGKGRSATQRTQLQRRCAATAVVNSYGLWLRLGLVLRLGCPHQSTGTGRVPALQQTGRTDSDCPCCIQPEAAQDRNCYYRPLTWSHIQPIRVISDDLEWPPRSFACCKGHLNTWTVTVKHSDRICNIVITDKNTILTPLH